MRQSCFDPRDGEMPNLTRSAATKVYIYMISESRVLIVQGV